MTSSRGAVVLLASLACVGVFGCTSSQSSSDPGKADQPTTLLEPFDPPTLAEIDAKAAWIDQPVRSAIEMLREHWEERRDSAPTAKEALALKNDSPENNAKIIAGLGYLPASAEEVDEDATLARHYLNDLKSMNPLLQSSVQEMDYLVFTNLTLVGFDWNMDLFANGEAVSSWQTSQDRMLDKVVLRDDLTWSDGRPLTAHDVVFSFKTIMDPRVPIPAVRSGVDKLRWVEAYDDRTLVFFHKEPTAIHMSYLSYPIIPKHIYEHSVDEDPTLQQSAHHVKYETSPITSGPYEVVSRTRNQEIVCARRESYYMHEGKQVRDKPFFKQIRIKIISERNVALIGLKSGQIDELELSVDQWTGQTDGSDFYERNTKATEVEWVSFHVIWNLKSPMFSDQRVRQAMTYAIDHQEMIEKLLHGLYQPSTGIFHKDSWMLAGAEPTQPYKQDLDKAEVLLDEAGWEDSDGDGVRDKLIGGRTMPFEFTLLVRPDPERERICELLKFNLEQIGVRCNIQRLEPTVLQERLLKKEFQAAMGGWGTGTDPYTSENIWGTDEERNFGSYSNPEVDKLYEQAIREFDRSKRAESYARIHKIIYEDQPYLFLYNRNAFYGFNKELRGWKFSPRGPYGYSPGTESIWRVAAH